MAKKIYRCGCGEVLGEQCAAETSNLTGWVVVEHVPDWLRSTHEAAGGTGVYPCNGSVRFTAHPECARELVRHDGEWTRIVGSGR
jgi:hypothetical protein